MSFAHIQVQDRAVGDPIEGAQPVDSNDHYALGMAVLMVGGGCQKVSVIF